MPLRLGRGALRCLCFVRCWLPWVLTGLSCFKSLTLTSQQPSFLFSVLQRTVDIRLMDLSAPQGARVRHLTLVHPSTSVVEHRQASNLRGSDTPSLFQRSLAKACFTETYQPETLLNLTEIACLLSADFTPPVYKLQPSAKHMSLRKCSSYCTYLNVIHCLPHFASASVGFRPCLHIVHRCFKIAFVLSVAMPEK